MSSGYIAQWLERLTADQQVCPLRRYVEVAEHLWVEAVPIAAVQCKLRRRELNPGLPRDRRKY